jgi:hypothetical protein
MVGNGPGLNSHFKFSELYLLFIILLLADRYHLFFSVVASHKLHLEFCFTEPSTIHPAQ